MEIEPLQSGSLGREDYDGGVGTPKPTEIGEEGANTGNRLMLSLRNKIKGLFDLGDSPPLLR